MTMEQLVHWLYPGCEQQEVLQELEIIEEEILKQQSFEEQTFEQETVDQCYEDMKLKLTV